MRIKTPLANAGAPHSSPRTGSQRQEPANVSAGRTNIFVPSRVDEPCRACVRSVSAPRRASDDQPPISCLGNEDAKKFHDLRKISFTPELKYFGPGSLLCLRRNIAG